MHLIAQHPALCVLVGYWLFSAFADGMPAPSDRSGVAYIWLHNSLQMLAGNLRRTIAVRFPSLADDVVPKLQANAAAGHLGTLCLFILSNPGFFTAKAVMLRNYFAARFPLRQAPVPTTLFTQQPTEPGDAMSTTTAPLAAAKPNEFIRFIDKVGELGHFFVKAEPIALKVAEEAEPIVLALTPFGPEYDVAVTAVETAQMLAKASIAAGTNLTNEQKLQIAVSNAAPALATILQSKGVTTDQTTHITNFIQSIFGLLAGPIVTIEKTIAEGAKS